MQRGLASPAGLAHRINLIEIEQRPGQSQSCRSLG
jgi:hypothetical protein